MPDERPTDFTVLAVGALEFADWLVGVDVSNTTDNAAGSDVLYGPSVVTRRLSSTHTVATTASTEVTDLTLALPIGTYVFQYYLRARTATVTVSPMFNLNFTGTAVGNWWFEFADASATLLAAIGTADDVGVTSLGFAMRMAQNAFATSATGNMGITHTTNSLSATATNHLFTIQGLVTVSAAGNLALWHGSETATSTSLEVGTTLVVTRSA